MKKIGFCLFILIILAGCVTPPKIVGDFISRDLPQNCQKLFLSFKYQEPANTSITSHAFFAVGRTDDEQIAVCGASWGGKLATTALQVKSMALSQCESMRINYMKRNSQVVKKCDIYAEGNKILFLNP